MIDHFVITKIVVDYLIWLDFKFHDEIEAIFKLFNGIKTSQLYFQSPFVLPQKN